MSIIVFAPHPDDEVLGVGGTLAKYAAEGERTIVVVFSSGTASHPLHKEGLITKTRKDEAQAAQMALGVKSTVFLELEDGNIREQIIEKELIPKIHELIKKEKPTKLFIPAVDDMHGDHRAVTHAILQLHSQYELTIPVYTYTIWSLFTIFKRGQPRLVVDTSKYHATKLAAAKAYRSQWVSMYQHVPLVTIKNFFAGMRYGHRWAETFIQVK